MKLTMFNSKTTQDGVMTCYMTVFKIFLFACLMQIDIKSIRCASADGKLLFAV